MARPGAGPLEPTTRGVGLELRAPARHGVNTSLTSAPGDGRQLRSSARSRAHARVLRRQRRSSSSRSRRHRDDGGHRARHRGPRRTPPPRQQRGSPGLGARRPRQPDDVPRARARDAVDVDVLVDSRARAASHGPGVSPPLARGEEHGTRSRGRSRQRRLFSTGCRAGRFADRRPSLHQLRPLRGPPGQAGSSTCSTCECSGACCDPRTARAPSTTSFVPVAAPTRSQRNSRTGTSTAATSPASRANSTRSSSTTPNCDDVYFKHSRVQGL